MIDNLLLYLGILGGTMALTLLYYAVFIAAQDLDPGHAGGTIQKRGADLLSERTLRPEDARRAVIHCAACPPAVPNRYEAMGYTDCNVLNLDFGGNLACANGCLGFGSCAKVCPTDAIVLRGGTVFVSALCSGCGQCVRVCPKHLIELVPVSNLTTISCAATGHNDSNSLCPIALDRNPYTIDYRKLRDTGFKLLGK